MTDPRDTDLQRYLDGDSPLSHRYRQASAESPPPGLDDAILKAARDAVTARPRRRRSRWAVPLALAATTLLGVNLVWMLRDDAVPQAPPRAVAQKAEADTVRAGAAQEQRSAAQPATQPVRPAATQQREAIAAEEPASEADEARRAPTRLERQAFSAKRAQPSAAERSALHADAAPVRDGSGEFERAVHGLAVLLRAGDLAEVRAQFGASGISDARLRQAANILAGAELQPREERDGLWLVDCVGPAGEVLCWLDVRKTDDGWRLSDLTFVR